MAPSRRESLAAGTSALPLALAPSALAPWQPSQRYPDPAIKILDPSFACSSTSLFSLYVNTQGAPGG